MPAGPWFTVSAEHPALPGHFPGAPIVPGVLLLDELLRTLMPGGAAPRWRIAQAKFLKPVRPGEVLRLEHDTALDGMLHFRVLSGDEPVAVGTLIAASSHGDRTG